MKIIVSRQRQDFNQVYRHYDKDAHELWNSSQMECRCVLCVCVFERVC